MVDMEQDKLDHVGFSYMRGRLTAGAQLFFLPLLGLAVPRHTRTITLIGSSDRAAAVDDIFVALDWQRPVCICVRLESFRDKVDSFLNRRKVLQLKFAGGFSFPKPILRLLFEGFSV